MTFDPNLENDADKVSDSRGPKEARTDKPWGYEILHNRTSFITKTLYIRAGGRTSVHYHEDKDEMMFVHSGLLTIQRGESPDQVKKLKPGEVIWIGAKDLHRLIANDGPVMLFEASVGSLTDVVRIEDDYGRA